MFKNSPFIISLKIDAIIFLQLQLLTKKILLFRAFFSSQLHSKPHFQHIILLFRCLETGGQLYLWSSALDNDIFLNGPIPASSNSNLKCRWCAWDSNPGASGLKTQTNPLGYGGTPRQCFFILAFSTPSTGNRNSMQLDLNCGSLVSKVTALPTRPFMTSSFFVFFSIQ